MDAKLPPEIAELLIWKEPRLNSNSDDLPFPIAIGVKGCVKPCEDCGRDCVNRRLEIKFIQRPKPHWRTTCVNCKLTQNPTTGLFEIKGSESQAFFRNFFSTKTK